MEGGAAAAVEVLLQNLIDLSKKEISQIRRLDKDAAKLAGSLDAIKNFLKDAETREITSDAVKSWMKKLQNKAFDADNVLDEINYHILSKQIKATKPMKAKVLSSFSSSFSSIARPRKMAVKIQEINENLESIKKEATELGLVERLAVEPTLVIASWRSSPFFDDPVFIGRDDVKLEIIEMITNNITTDERAVSIISIVGMGGLGKTTLTKKVFNHLKNKNRFGSYIWVHVSPNFDPIILFKKILKELSSYDQVEVESKQDILSKLQKALEDKTYLLILDDVWNEDLFKWEDFINSLLVVSCVKGNAIVVTTRSMHVASIVNPIHTYELESLSEEDCWSIIKFKTFGEGNVRSAFEAIGRKIARRCRGLPLAANIVGGVLHNESEETWRSIEEKWLSADEGGDNLTLILRLSFDNLSPPSLKKCFAYCAMFPKGSQIMKQELIEMWMAEGFLQVDGRDDMESVGKEFINVLLHNYLLQVSERDDDGNVESYGMHDFVHDLACSVSSSSNSRVRYMTLEEDESSRIPREMVRTLLFEGDISGIDFSDFESLHVLRLDSEVRELPSSIQKLIHLRDFDISKTRIEVLPDWIGEFFHLQTLRANSEYLRKLPSTIKYLINLRHLYFNEKVELPMGIGRLTSLQTLMPFPVGDKNGCKIEELGSLNNLEGELQIWNLERVNDKEEAGKANLFNKSKILNLCLKWNESREGERNYENVLEGLQPHSDLKKLAIVGFKGKRFPLWTLKMAVRDVGQGSWVVLNKLMSLILSNCDECEEIPMLGHLPNLKSLKLEELRNLECINSSFYGMVNNDTRIVFPALERFELSSMPKLAEWAEIEISSGSEVKLFPRLQYLRIHQCEQLMNVPSLGQLPDLMSLELIGLSNLECRNSSFFGMVNTDTRIVFPSLERFELSSIPKLAEWAEIEISNGSEVKVFPRLQYLRIHQCQQLMNIPSLGQLPDLKSLVLEGLGNLECINSSFYGMVNKDTRIVFPSLERLELSSMHKLAKWAEIEISSGSEVKVFPRLQHLEIKWCEQLLSVPSHVSSCLQHLIIIGTGLQCLPADWLFSNNQTLSHLYISSCPNLRELSDSGGEQSQGSFTSLRNLKIHKCEELEYLPYEMLGFSLEKLWLMRLSSLKNLSVVIDRLPELPRLTDLNIYGVPKFMATGCLEISAFPSLRNISIDVSMGDSSSMETVEAILQGCCHSLNELRLKGMESWECLPESIQHLIALSRLTLLDFEVEELPEWFGKLASLQQLNLCDCKRLRRLPSMDAMRRLTTLNIIGCPELVNESKVVDSEWPKVSHIPHIAIDGFEYIADDNASHRFRTWKQLLLRKD